MHSNLVFLVTISGVLLSVQGLPQQPPPNNNDRGGGNPSPPQEPVVIPIPQVPVAGNCGADAFPGSPKWNACFQKFQEDMRIFQYQMQLYSQRMVQANPQKQEQNSHFNIGPYTSSVMTNGYAIKTFGIPVSTITRDSVINIKLTVGNFDGFETKTEGNEMIMEMKSGGGLRKYASLKVPDGIKLNDVKFERSADSIMITGPVKSNGGGGVSHSYTTSGTSAGSGTNFVSTGSQWNSAGMSQPAFPGFNPPMPFFTPANMFPPMWFF